MISAIECLFHNYGFDSNGSFKQFKNSFNGERTGNTDKRVTVAACCLPVFVSQDDKRGEEKTADYR